MLILNKIKVGLVTWTLLVVLGAYKSAHADVTYLTSLRGEEFEMGNLLEWSTMKEYNSSLFVVEKSVDGVHFDQIGNVDAAGNTLGETKYHYLDIGVSEKKSFYRLRQIDADGTISFSHTILVRKWLSNKFAVININTSEVQDQLVITLNCSSSADIDVAISNGTGKQVLDTTVAVDHGLHEIPLDMAALPEGIYRVSLTMGMEREVLVLRKISGIHEDIVNKKKVKD